MLSARSAYCLVVLSNLPIRHNAYDPLLHRVEICLSMTPAASIVTVRSRTAEVAGDTVTSPTRTSHVTGRKLAFLVLDENQTIPAFSSLSAIAHWHPRLCFSRECDVIQHSKECCFRTMSLSISRLKLSVQGLVNEIRIQLNKWTFLKERI